MSDTRTVIPTDERWGGLVGYFGGFVAAVFADAAVDPDYHLTSLSVRFRASVEVRPMEVVATRAHRGARTAATTLRLVQDGRLRAEASAVLLRHDVARASFRTVAPASDEPPAEYQVRPHPAGEIAYLPALEMRTAEHRPGAEGTRAWLRFTAPPPEFGVRSPHGAVCVLLDALFPVLFVEPDGPTFVPTLEFTYQFTPALADVGRRWFVGENHLDWHTDDFCSEDATLRDAATGLVVARQRQLRSLVRTLPGTAVQRPSYALEGERS